MFSREEVAELCLFAADEWDAKYGHSLFRQTWLDGYERGRLDGRAGL